MFNNIYDIPTWNIKLVLDIKLLRWLILSFLTVGLRYKKLDSTHLKFLTIVLYDKRSRSKIIAKIKYKKFLAKNHF
jgi:hypothetical protein